MQTANHKNWFKRAKTEGCHGWLAVRLPVSPSNKIIQWGRENIPDNILFKEKGSQGEGRELDTHITISYGICADDVNIIKNILKEKKPIKIKLKEIGFFDVDPDKNPLIVKIESKDLQELNEKLSHILNIESTFDDYKPHCTIAYLNKGEAKQFAGNKEFYNTELILNKIVFINNIDEETEFKLKGS
jgi:hypothetical protein